MAVWTLALTYVFQMVASALVTDHNEKQVETKEKRVEKEEAEDEEGGREHEEKEEKGTGKKAKTKKQENEEKWKDQKDAELPILKPKKNHLPSAPSSE